MRQAGSQHLVAGQATWPGPGIRAGAPRSGEPVEGGGLIPLPQPERGERLAALGSERRDPGVVARVADGRDYRVHVVEGQRGGGQSRSRPQEPEVGQEAVGRQRQRPAAAGAARGEVKHRAAAKLADPPRQAAVAFSEQRVEDARSKHSFGLTVAVRAASGTGGAGRAGDLRAACGSTVGGHERDPVAARPSAARVAATARSAAGKKPWNTESVGLAAIRQSRTNLLHLA